ncbi:MAG: tRNA (N6-isopentenyl adenosine(37)-C2)-methylthiotransferase MiaB [Alphaproteobacteria bacterium]|nr:tRNA (N6-isopentenyl adenosine(37)-C2)-methylthiotransferase MiaB [Alphaproteobacteria bacterium]
MKTYFIKTFGCQMNVYDSHRIAGILEQRGLQATSRIEDADLVIFNTCHIREKAAEKLFSDLGRANLVKQARLLEGKNTIIGVVGCVVQAEDEQVFKRSDAVDFALGPLTYHRLGKVLDELEDNSEIQVIDTEFPVESKFDFLSENKAEGVCSYIAIQEGCNNFCTYCVVPYTRGIETSRPVEDVLKEARKLVSDGALELNLLGQNVNSYHGEDKTGKERNLAYLLRKIGEIDGLRRLRYTTSYPADVDEDLIECHKDMPILMPYLHLPIQSGSDKILRAMNRRHTKSQYLDVIDRLREANPQIGFASDFIVGFPGESDEDFQATLDIVDEVKFITAFSFKYSPRPGTPAAEYPNQLPEKVKKERLAILQEKLFAYQTDFNQQTVGKTIEVLFENKGRHAGQLTGRTPWMQNLYAEANGEYLNKIVDVKVESATMNSLSGKIVKV